MAIGCDAGLRQGLRATRQRLERGARRRHVGRKEQHDRRLPLQRRDRAGRPGQILQREVRRRERLVQPGGGRRRRSRTWNRRRRRRRGRGERRPSRRRRPSTIRRRLLSGTSVNTCVPPDGQSTVSFTMRSLAPSPISSSFECCDRNPEPAWTILRLAQPIGLDGDARADRVAVALRPRETDGARAWLTPSSAAIRNRCGRSAPAAPAARP